MNEQRNPAAMDVKQIPGGYKVAYVYSRDNPNDAHIAGGLTEDEARRIVSNIAKLPKLLRRD